MFQDERNKFNKKLGIGFVYSEIDYSLKGANFQGHSNDPELDTVFTPLCFVHFKNAVELSANRTALILKLKSIFKA